MPLKMHLWREGVDWVIRYIYKRYLPIVGLSTVTSAGKLTSPPSQQRHILSFVILEEHVICN